MGKDSKYQWQPSKSGVVSPKVGQDHPWCFESATEPHCPKPETISPKHTPKGRWAVVVNGVQGQVCTRHKNQTLEAGGRLESGLGKSYRATVKARTEAQAEAEPEA